MRFISAAVISICCSQLHANAIQYFSGMSFNNSADIARIKDTEFVFGGSAFAVSAGFQGTQLNFNTFAQDPGSSNSRTTSLLPYGRIGKRINNQFVFAVDVTQPFHSNLNWGNNAVTRYAATQTYLSDIDISPKLAVNFSETLQIAAGINFNFLQNNETNWAMPTGPTTYGNMLNKTSSYGTGFNVAFNYMLTKQDIIGLVYYSTTKQNTHGYSRLGNLVNSQLKFYFNLPSTSVASYTHIFGPKWLTSWQWFHTEWHINQYAPYYNTAAGHFMFNLHYSRSNAIFGIVRHQYNDKFGIGLAGMIDRGPEKEEFRPLNFPSDTQYLLGFIADYKVNKETTIELLYGHGYEKTCLANSIPFMGQQIPFTTGKVNINADIVDLRIKIQK